jgi:hypothetical protein
VQVAANQELLDEKAGHDGLTGAGIVGEKEAEGLPRQHIAINSDDLVGEGIDYRRVNRDKGIKEICEVNPLRLGNQAKELPVSIEAPGTAGFDDFE